MPFNKAKLLDAAQRFLNQGKVAQAIGQYQEILRYEPHDQVTLMTLGDLYVRIGDTAHAVEVFQQLGELFHREGFTSKAIAIYKKIAKLTPNDPKPLERLGELYTLQGVLSEARPLFLQLAEMHVRSGRADAAAAVLRRLAELEPDNVRVQMRLVGLYHSLGQKSEAVATCLRVAERLLQQHEHDEAENLVRRALELEPNHRPALVLRARIAAAAGRTEQAVAQLEALPAPGPELLGELVALHLKLGNTARAAECARRAFAEQREQFPLVFEVAEALLEGGAAEAAWELLEEIRDAMGVAGEYEKLARALDAVAERLPGRVEPLDRLVEIYRRTGDTFRLPDALFRLGEALAAVGERERARMVFQELLERTGDDERVRQRLNQLGRQLGLAPVDETAPAEPPGPEPPAPPVLPVPEEWMDADTQRFVNQALVDADLFASYGQVPKAVELLEAVLARVPNHTGALEKLLDLSLGTGNDRRTAELAHQLELLYRERADEARAERFADLRRRFQRAAGITAEELTVAEEPVTVPPPAPEPSPPAVEAAVYELDLSEEWSTLAEAAADSALVVEDEVVPAAPVETVEPHAAEPSPLEPVTEAFPVEVGEPDESPAVQAPAVAMVPAPAEEDGVEYALEPSTLPPPMTPATFLAELAAELGEPEPEAPPAVEARAPAASLEPGPAAPAAATPKEPSQQLAEVFEEFRAELGGLGEEEEDLETHYNLGIAYREMGLLEEAIGEFQRVAKAVQSGRPFRYAMQCCILLALCFMEKNQPRAAALWYERALHTAGLDQETEIALRYDLGVALEQAGDARGALDCFLQVYAMNIDYRDVAERIAALEKRR
ncbi:MAG: tetratricopeptide repeat protein [Acidobacteriia bacterium]|jgi:tetratricopeptide (TPR) repeat protein|nr:tetratricopeptide repeat protein [Terriglobia bacterium]